MSIILAASEEWIKVFGVIVGMFVLVYFLVNIYSAFEKKANIKDEDGCGWPIFLIIVAVIVGVLLNLKKCKCEGHKDNQYDPSEEYWEDHARHTKLQEPVKNNVNNIIFTPS